MPKLLQTMPAAITSPRTHETRRPATLAADMKASTREAADHAAFRGASSITAR
jgi:hypothetical protein